MTASWTVELLFTPRRTIKTGLPTLRRPRTPFPTIGTRAAPRAVELRSISLWTMRRRTTSIGYRAAIWS